MSEEFRNLMVQLSHALGEALQESDKVKNILRRIEDAGADSGITLALVLGMQGQNTEIHKVVLGRERSQGIRATQRRVSAFDRRFLRALRIQLPE